MNRAKIVIFFVAALLLVISCGQSPSANSQNSNTSRSGAADSTATSNTAGGTIVNQSVNNAQRLQRSSAMVDVDDLAADEGAYKENCMICHKDTGKGGKSTIEGKSINAADLTSAKMKARSDEKLLAGIRDGAPDDGMPAFKDKLSDGTIKAIIKHIRNLQAAQ